MNNNSYYIQGNRVPQSYYNSNRQGPMGGPGTDDRFGFLGPFLLGGITGGLVAPLFNNGGCTNCYPYPYYPPAPYPYYPPAPYPPRPPYYY